MEGFLGGSVVKNPPSKAEDSRDEGSISGSVRPTRKEMATHSTTLAWKIPRTEEPDGLQSMRSQSRTLLSMHLYLSSVSGLEKRVAVKVV